MATSSRSIRAALVILSLAVAAVPLRAQVPPVAPPAPDTVRAPRPAPAEPDTTRAPRPAPVDPDAPLIEPDARPDTIPRTAPDTIPVPGDSLGPVPPQLDASVDSLLQELRRLEGFVITEYQGDRATYRADTGILRLEGNAAVTRIGDRLTADTIVFDDRADLVTAFGDARVIGEAQELASDTLFYDLALRRATALGARTQVTETATWFVQGDMTLEGTDRLYAAGGHFTSCDLEIPHYHFEADKVMVWKDRILVARPARLYIGKVPVMVLPFIVQNLEQGRRSGFLTPRFGVNDIVRTSSGYTRQVSDIGFYWAINDYMGALMSTTWRSGAYTSLLGTLDFNWRRQFLNGSFTTERYWRSNGDRELSFNGLASWQPDERTNIGFNARYHSSADFVRDVSYDPTDVTRDMNSSLSMSRRFGWGRISLGGDRRQSIANGDVSMTLPSFSLSLNPVTLFSAPTPESQRWYSNATFTPGVIQGRRSTSSFGDNFRLRQQDREITELDLSPSFSIGNFSVSGRADVNRTENFAVSGVDANETPIDLPGFVRDEASWNVSMSYRQALIGTTFLSPSISWSQDIVRDTLTSGQLLRAPTRMSLGASLNSDLYGFFPGFWNFSAIRHRLSPRLSYSYAPAVVQSELQDRVFGQAGGRTRNRLSLSINQTWEAKLRTPTRPEENVPLPPDTLAGDSIPGAALGAGALAGPTEPDKVTILSLNTSPFEYDFVKAQEEGNGWVTERVSNTINSDYLRGLTIQMQHELFDKRDLDPSLPENVGKLGRFAPRLTSLSTSFQLGPQTALIRWIRRIAFGGDQEEVTQPQQQPTPGILPAEEDREVIGAVSQSTATANPQGVGGGPWSASLSYQFTRPPRTFQQGQFGNDDAIQTINGNMSFQLTPNWSVSWNTSYSLTDGEFGSHSLNFRRDLHEWQANFSFFQAPNGNTAFEFYVQLLHNQDLRFDYSERDLGIDRR